MWKNVQVTLDGALLGSIETKQQLEAGSHFALPDGSQLQVQLKREGIATELQVRRNGEPLPGSTSDPEQRVASAATMLYFIAGLNAALGIMAALGVEFLARVGLGYTSVVVGAVYAGLAYLVKTKQSRVALLLAIALFVLDGLASIFAATQAGGSPPIGGIVARIFLLIPMWKGVSALAELKEQSPRPT